ncbi:unnamed protein product, partial [Didymodactylos carnosus]
MTSDVLSASMQYNVPYSITPGKPHNFDLLTENDSKESSADPPFISSQLRTEEWLQRYGLKPQKLSFDQILQLIGFQRLDNYNSLLGKNITAQYSGNLYYEVQRDNGDRYSLTCRPEKLREYRHRLLKALNLLRKRLTFITSGSRRLFGIIGEPSVCLICDCKTSDQKTFNQYQKAVITLLKEQIIKIKRFNIMWITNDVEQFQSQGPVDITPTIIDRAIDWVSQRICSKNKISLSSTSEAIILAMKNNVHSVYLITEGESSNTNRELLRDQLIKLRSINNISLHVISLFCNNSDTETYLKSLAQCGGGTFFTYKIKSELPDLTSSTNSSDPTRIKVQSDKLLFGSVTAFPTDISLLYKEINECQNTIDKIEKILGFMQNDSTGRSISNPESSKASDVSSSTISDNFQRSLVSQSSANDLDGDMASLDWLKLYGLEAQKLDFFSVLHSAAFRHCDGVVTVLKPPNDKENSHMPTDPRDKLINAKYCDQFAHVAWPDGTIRHVHVTPELHRDYERRVRALLGKIKARLLWLKKGSRDVFGSILEKNIYILIDTSKSMQNHLGFVKDKMLLLLQDQLFSKERVNMIAFNTVINPWRDRLTKISDATTHSQILPWIQSLNAEGSTNTLAALRFALADTQTEAIYLLTDGRPDQNERHILSQVQYRHAVPIHTIAFNCQDVAANQFLYDLAKQTGGRFHAFNYGLVNDSIELPESEDVGLLKQELTRGENELKRVAELRDECIGRAWSKENGDKLLKSRELNSSITTPLLKLKNQNTFTSTYRSNVSMHVKQSKQHLVNNRKRRAKSSSLLNEASAINLRPDQWLLPETCKFLLGNNSKNENARTEVSEHEVLPTKNDGNSKAQQINDKPSTPDDEVTLFLKKNSLIAKHLTIFDILQPSVFTVKPGFVQLIDRYVISKVWDDILPLAHGPYVGKLRLINHLAVDLVTYEQDLNALLKTYYDFASEIIWKYLSEDQKRKLAPSIYWTSLKENEQKELTKDITQEEYTSQSALEYYAWKKLSDDEQKTFMQKSAPYYVKNKVLLQNALVESESPLKLKSILKLDNEIEKAIKFYQISIDLRQHQKHAEILSKKVEDVKPKRVIERPFIYDLFKSVGQRVIARYDVDGLFYP